VTKRDMLESWKDISAHLGRNSRTCQRWEREFGLPVHRLDGSSKSRVYAYKDELDEWLGKRLNDPEIRRRQAGAWGKPRWPWLLAAILPALVLGGVGGRYLFRKVIPADPSRKPLLAVLHFANNTGDPELEYLCESVPANLILDIQRASGNVTVLSSGRMLTVLRQLGLAPGASLSSDDVRNIVDKTGASHTVEGFVSSEGGSLRVDYVIREGRSRRLVSTDRIVGGEARLLDIEDLLAAKVMAAFESRRGRSPRRRVLCSPQADRLYEMARSVGRTYDLGGSPNALGLEIELLGQARDIDPECVKVHAALGNAYRTRYATAGRSPQDLALMARHYETAYDLNPDLAETNAGLGWCGFFQGDIEGACEHFTNSRGLDPDNLDIAFGIAEFLEKVGLLERAVRYCSLVIERTEAPIAVYLLRARCLAGTGNFEAALADLDGVLRLDAADVPARCARAGILVMLKRFEEAQDDLALAESLSPGHPDILWTGALLWTAKGEKDKALAAVAPHLKETTLRTEIVSRVYAGLGLWQEALSNMSGAIQAGLAAFGFVPFPFPVLNNPNDYFLQPLRSDPRFIEILGTQERAYEERAARCRGL